MPPRQWEPIVSDFTRVQKLVHLAMRQDPMDMAAISAEVFRAKRQAYEDGLTVQAANVGCAGRKGVAGHDILSEIKMESEEEAAGIVNTYNYDMALAVRHIRSEVPTANRYVYAKRLGEWEGKRSDWKSKQIMLWNTMKWRDRATGDFMAMNPQVAEGYAILMPRGPAVCNVCIYWRDRGRVPLEEAKKVEWPAHLNCPHYWETHYRKKKADCKELWVGIPLSAYYDEMAKAVTIPIEVKGGAGSGNWGHTGRPGLVGGSGGRGGGMVVDTLSTGGMSDKQVDACDTFMANASSVADDASWADKKRAAKGDFNDEMGWNTERQQLTGDILGYTQGYFRTIRAAGKAIENGTVDKWIAEVKRERPEILRKFDGTTVGDRGAAEMVTDYRGEWNDPSRVKMLDPRHSWPGHLTVGRALRAATQLNYIIRNSDPQPPLYRGESLTPSAHAAMSSYTVGDTITMSGPTSFTLSGTIASNHARGFGRGVGGHRPPENTPWIFEVSPGAHGLNVNAMSPWKQSEVLTQGLFEITGMDAANGVVQMCQVDIPVYELPTVAGM